MSAQYPTLEHFENFATDRVVEEPWVVAKVQPGERLLDVGSATSRYLQNMPNGVRVYAVDLRPTRPEPNIAVVRGDVKHPPFRSGSFNVVSCISTIEHVGCDIYGQSLDEFGDIVAMRHIRRLLRPDGRLLVTAPYGKRHVTAWLRVYDWKSFKELSAGYRIKTVEFYKLADDEYLPCDRSEIEGVLFDWLHTRSNGVILAELTPVGGLGFALARLKLRFLWTWRLITIRKRVWRFWDDPEIA